MFEIGEGQSRAVEKEDSYSISFPVPLVLMTVGGVEPVRYYSNNECRA